MPSKTDFNVVLTMMIFTESKKFHRVLYRPHFVCSSKREN